ncbi:unnamed protein product [Adineta steineri]|uniref:Importin N-terminal domain-containing protein n=3 Tax=Adineta steineri TaxID=433720 RepID=A0A814XLB9_9BILA|nr:unnamed protein product [Adineta steineri]CAF1218400.1 unnamed protein product [Adineta steineri]
MDLTPVVEALQATLSPQLRKQAEEKLTQICKTTGFVPCLLQIVLSEQCDMGARQAGAIYLKNHINTYWSDYNDPKTNNDPDIITLANAVNVNINTPVSDNSQKLFVVSDPDKEYLRNILIDAIIRTKDPLRCQLIATAGTMIKNDFPSKWPQFINQIHSCLSTDNIDAWDSTLLVYYTLVQHYEYKKSEDRTPIDDVMVVILPILHQRFMQLFAHNDSDQSALIQKQILKIFHAYTQLHLSFRVLPTQTMATWLDTCCAVLERRLPERLDALDEEDRAEHPWWKCKKWALHILIRIFERHGSPANLPKGQSPDRIEFANFYLKGFSGKVIGLVFNVLEAYRQKVYVSPRVLQLSLNYLRESVRHAFSWKIMQNNIVVLIQDIIYPLLCVSDDDIELFNEEPVEFVRARLDILDEYISPVSAAELFLADAVAKRKDVLMKTVSFLGTIIHNDSITVKQKDGILHMLGVIGNVLIKKKAFANQLENMIVQYLFPELQSPTAFLRARACYALRNFSKLEYTNPDNSVRCLTFLINCLCNDTSLPVKVEAAMALNLFMSDSDTGEKGKAIIIPHLQIIVMRIIEIIRQTEIDDIMIVLQKIVGLFDQELQPIAVQMTSQLVEFFKHVVCSENTPTDESKAEERTVAAMGVLNTLDTIVSCMGEKQEILSQIEQIIYEAIVLVLRDGILDFYEEILTLVDTLTINTVSPLMWQVFYLIKEAFFRDAADYFAEIMNCLHNYVVNDTPSFLAQPDRLETVFEMCKHVIVNDLGEDSEAHAVKLIEVIILQCQDNMSAALPAIVQMMAQRFQREIVTSELRLMLIQVFIVILWLNPDRFFQTLNTVAANDPSTQSVIGNFFNQWMTDSELFAGVHDRRVCSLGLCTLLRIDAKYYSAISNIVPKILPNCIHIYQGLMKTYQHNNEDDSEDDTDDDDDSVPSEIDDGDDENIEHEDDFLGKLKGKVPDHEMAGDGLGEDNNEDDDDNSDFDIDETDLESYSTILEANEDIDEFQIFCDSLQQLQSDTTGYNQALLQNLTDEQRKQIQNIIHYTEKRKQEKESNKIREAGGYNFSQSAFATQPTNFNFGGSANTSFQNRK